MIKVRDVCLRYGETKALYNLDLDIKKNTTCAIIGPSGCGKTTLLYSLAGLVRPDSGSIFVDGEKLQGVRRETALILQDYGLLPWKTVLKNVTFTLESRGVAKEQAEKKAFEMLNDLDMESLASRLPGELSGGQKQRTAIARALSLEPDVLLMDEASSALDAITKESLHDLILSIYRKKPMTLVMVTHNIEEAAFLGQKILVMKEGSISHELDNPCFGDAKIRTELKFYEYCLKIRGLLYE